MRRLAVKAHNKSRHSDVKTAARFRRRCFRRYGASDVGIQLKADISLPLQLAVRLHISWVDTAELLVRMRRGVQ
jgi:hypothetical protein